MSDYDIDLTHRPRVINAEFIDTLTINPRFKVTGGEVYETQDKKTLHCIKIVALDDYEYLYSPNATFRKLINKLDFHKTSELIDHYIVFYTIPLEVGGDSVRGIRVDKILGPDGETVIYSRPREKQEEQTSLDPPQPLQEEQSSLDPE